MSVILIAATTICGRIGPISPGSATDRQFLEKMRDASGASLIGAGTLRMSDPEIRGTGEILSPDRIRSVITGSGDIPTTSKKIFADRPAPIIFTMENNVSLLRDKLRDHAELIGLAEESGRLSIKAVINELKKRTTGDILIEGGGQLNYSALKEQVVDEIHLTICPRISGHATAASLAAGPEPLGTPFTDLQLIDMTTGEAGELFVRYRVK